MAKKVITEQEVFDVAQGIAAQGETPSTLSVHKALGRGSYSTIQKYLKAWENSDQAREAHIDTLPAVVNLPDALADDAVGLGKKMWKVANDLAEAKLDRERLALNNLRENLELSTQQAIDYADECNRRAEEAEDEVDASRSAITDYEERVNKYESEVNSLTADLLDSKKMFNEATSKISALTNDKSELATKVKLAEQEVMSVTKQIAKVESSSEKALADAIAKADKALSDAVAKAEKDQAKVVADLSAAHDKAVRALTVSSDKAMKALKDDAEKSAKQYQATIDLLTKDKGALAAEIKALRADAVKAVK